MADVASGVPDAVVLVADGVGIDAVMVLVAVGFGVIVMVVGTVGPVEVGFAIDVGVFMVVQVSEWWMYYCFVLGLQEFKVP